MVQTRRNPATTAPKAKVTFCVQGVTIPPRVATFMLTSLQSADEIVAQQRRCRTNTVQICDRLEAGDHRALRQAMPGVSLVQVVHVTGKRALDEVRAAAPHVDAVLLDSGRPEAAVKELGVRKGGLVTDAEFVELVAQSTASEQE